MASHVCHSHQKVTQVTLVALEEIKVLLARSKLEASKFGIEPRFVRHVPVDFRVVLRWVTDQSNLDLVFRAPGGWEGM